MTKNLKLSFIFYAVLCAVVVSFRTLLNFFSGAGLNFVTMVAMLVAILAIFLSDNYVKNRTRDIFIIACVLTGLEFIVYFIFEFQIGSITTWNVFLGFQNFFSILGILFAGYLAFRFICEFKEIKFSFVEILLGNKKLSKKAKKAKELTNGSLEDKPNNHKEDEEVSEPIVETTENFEE